MSFNPPVDRGCKLVLAPTQLALFFTTHDDHRTSGFIVRLDKSPVSSKRRSFIQALALNTTILILTIALALCTVVHDYYQPYPAHIRLAFSLTQNIILAASILTLVRSTLAPFFLRECRLRLKHGFQPTELVIRRLPHTMTLLNQPNMSFADLHAQASRSVDPALHYSRLSSLLSSEYWSLEYEAVMHAYSAVHAGALSEQDFDFAIWKQVHGDWVGYELWRDQELMSENQECSLFEKLSKT